MIFVAIDLQRCSLQNVSAMASLKSAASDIYFGISVKYLLAIGCRFKAPDLRQAEFSISGARPTASPTPAREEGRRLRLKPRAQKVILFLGVSGTLRGICH